METILFLAHTEADGTLAKTALEVLSAAVDVKEKLGGTLIVGLYGAQVRPAADSLANCGAQRFLAVQGEAFSQARYATDAAACEALLRTSTATIVIAAGTSRNARVMAGVAHRVGGAVDTHVTSADATSGSLTVTRWFYRQRIEGSLLRTRRPWILLLDPGAQAAWTGKAGAVATEFDRRQRAGIAHAHGRSRLCDTTCRSANHPSRREAVFCGGCGMDQEAERWAAACRRG